MADITVDVYPKVTLDMARVTVRLEKDDRNRNLIIEWWLFEGFENRKDEQVDGAQSKRTFQFLVKFEEGGDWTIRATIERSDGHPKVGFTSVHVIGRG